MREKSIIILSAIASAALFCSFESPAMTHDADSLVRVGDSLRMRYRFEESLDAYRGAIESLKDTSGICRDSAALTNINDRILLSENGRNMSAFVGNPSVVAKHRFSIEDFYLYYPLPDNSWRSVPNQLDTMAGHPFLKALYAPEGDRTIYFSSVDQEGIRNIARTELQDSIWTYPSLINEQMTSVADDIYPMLSPDRRSLFFSSAGLYGVGGYDLYVSEWDDETADWSTPVNLGFPFSSPADDFLLINTDDGKYTIFASNRECGKDSVYVYVLEYDSMPVRKAVDDPQELAAISRLEPSGHIIDDGSDVNADIPENVDTRRYMEKMAEVRALSDSLSLCEISLEEDRNLYVMSSDADERIALTNRIMELESKMPSIQDSLARATEILRKIEMEFLFSGVVIDPDKLMAAADREVVGEATSYTFTRMGLGESLSLAMMPPPVVFDYTFKVLEEGQFALDNTLPEGIVYQIQLFSLSTKATVKNLKGLSPVFEHKAANGRFTYRAGLFRTYKDVLANLNTVKRVGFRSAFIVAFNDGKEIAVSKARSIEAQLKAKPVFYEVRILARAAELDDASISGISQQASGKDIAKVESAEGTVYVIGPYSDKAAAESLVAFANAMGIGKVELKTINKQ